MRPIRYVATAADVSAGFTPPFPVDINTPVAAFGVQYLATGGGAGTGTFQQTLDDPFNPPSGGLIWDSVVMDANGRASVANSPVRAFRVNTPVLADVVTIIAQGTA